MIRRCIVLALVVICVLTLGKGFLLHSEKVYGFHDITQYARVSDFSINLAHGIIPPRIAPNFSHQRGYPVFNHYAPLAYYITAGLHFAGMGIPYAVKVSFFLAVMTAGIGMWAWMRGHLSQEGALVGGILYSTSAYLGTEVFVRGNLAEVWFIAVFPCVLWAIDAYIQDKTYTSLVRVIGAVALLLLAHNVLSLVGCAVIILYSLPYRSSLLTIAIMTAIPLAGTFLFPAIFELAQTHATQIATQTLYGDHFICIKQLWNSPIGYGGSTQGCADGMSFQLGKVLILLGIAGVGWWGIRFFQSMRGAMPDTRTIQQGGILGLGLGSLFVASSYSTFLWKALPALDVFQFPWRFLVFVVFAGAYFGGYLIAHVTRPYVSLTLSILIVGASVYLAIPFFTPNPDAQWSVQEFLDTYLSKEYIQNNVAYQVPEYIPISVNLTAWMKLQETPEGLAQDKIVPLDGGEVIPLDSQPFSYTGATTSKDFYLDIHMAPYWTILIDNAVVTPHRIDDLGRPYFTSDAIKTFVDIEYMQTPLEKMSNAISLMTGVVLVGLCLKKWNQRY